MGVTEVAGRLGVSRSTIYRWLKRGQLGRMERAGLSVSRSGRRWVFEEAGVEWDKWPVSNVRLAFPVGMPSDVALLGLCDMPADVPVANQYDDVGNKLPDPVGICLSMVKFQIHDEGGEKLAEEAALPHEGRVQCVFGGKDLDALWNRLVPGGLVRVRVTAYPRFYELDQKGHAHLRGDDRGYHKGAEAQSPVYTLSRNEHAELLIDGKAEPKPVDPGPTAEEQAAIDESDRRMREEREAHERKDRESRERVERENREHNERMERERREHEEAQRRSRAEAEERTSREREEREVEERRAAAERERLGIRPDGDISRALNDPPSEDRRFLAIVNLWEAQYAPHDADGFKARLVDIRQQDQFAEAVDEVCQRLGWTL